MKKTNTHTSPTELKKIYINSRGRLVWDKHNIVQHEDPKVGKKCALILISSQITS